MQKRLAKELTCMVHSEELYNAALETSTILFNGGLKELSNLDETTFLDVFEGVPHYTILKTELEQGTGILEFLTEKTQVFPSKSEARKMIQGGGVSINKEKIESHELVVNENHLIKNKYLIIQKGKKNYYLCSVN